VESQVTSELAQKAEPLDESLGASESGIEQGGMKDEIITHEEQRTRAISCQH